MASKMCVMWKGIACAICLSLLLVWLSESAEPTMNAMPSQVGGEEESTKTILTGRAQPVDLLRSRSWLPQMRMSLPPFLARSMTELWSSCIASFSMIVVSELGDKTFFIAAVLALQHSHSTVWAGAMSALGGMTVLSVIVGFALPSILHKDATHYLSILLFFIFGVRLLVEGIKGTSHSSTDELREVEAELRRASTDDGSISPVDDTDGVTELKDLKASVVDNSADESPRGRRSSTKGSKKCHIRHKWLQNVVGHVFLQACTLTFLAEWGDRSQIATVALAASRDPVGVTIGAVAGHMLCTGIAVIGGKMLASRISERVVATAGGTLFLIFAVAGLAMGK